MTRGLFLRHLHSDLLSLSIEELLFRSFGKGFLSQLYGLARQLYFSWA